MDGGERGWGSTTENRKSTKFIRSPKRDAVDDKQESFSHMSRAKRKDVFEHAQKMFRFRLILRTHKVSSMPLFLIHSRVSNDSVSGQHRP